jgi:protein associated with RNAse G/E
VDVTTKPIRHAEVIHAVDLDLDVVRLRDGTVTVLDEDEFAEHQLLYDYPAEVIAQARATTDDLVARITAGIEPFATVGAAWLTDFAGSAEPTLDPPHPECHQ